MKRTYKNQLIKSVVSAAICAILIFSFAVNAYAENTEPQEKNIPQIVVGSANADPGAEVVVNVDLKNNPGICAFNLGIDYDTEKLVLNQVELGAGLSGTFNYKKTAVFSGGADFDMDQTILKLHFTANQNAARNAYVSVTYSYENGDISNYDEEDVYFEVLPGKVTFNGTETGGEIKNANINIGTDLKLQFFADVVIEEPASVFIETEDQDGNKLNIIDTTWTKAGYKFVLKVDPSKMADTFSINLKSGTATLDTVEYSIIDYCDSVVNQYPSDTKLKNLLANLLDYGAAAQLYQKHNTDNLANSLPWVSECVKTFNDVTTDVVRAGNGDNGARIRGASLDLNDTIIINFVTAATDFSNLKLKLYKNYGKPDSELLKEEAVNTANFVMRSEELEFYELDKIYTAVLERNGVMIDQVSYSVKSYVAAYQHTTKYENLDILVQRLWEYGQLAKQYNEGQEK